MNKENKSLEEQIKEAELLRLRSEVDKNKAEEAKIRYKATYYQ